MINWIYAAIIYAALYFIFSLVAPEMCSWMCVPVDAAADCLLSFTNNFLPNCLRKRKSIQGKRVLITGAGNGLGRLVALILTKEKCDLILWDIDEKGLEETKLQLKELAVEAHCYVVDMSKRENIYETAEKVRKEVGEVDIVINNASIFRDGGDFLKKDDIWIERTVQMAKAFLPHMKQQNYGHIACVASMSGIVGANNLCDYSSSKFAAMGFQEALENEMAVEGKTGIEFTTVCPSYIATNMLSGTHAKFLKNNKAKLMPQDVAEGIVHGILTNKRIVIMPADGYLLYALKGLLPRRTFQKFLLWSIKDF